MQYSLSLRFRSVPIVTLYVGAEKAIYHVHEKLLLDVSPVFKAGFSGEFAESGTRSMNLPDDDVDAVERMLQWLYTRQLRLSDAILEATSNDCCWELARLNTLADKYDIVALKNIIADKLFELYSLVESFSDAEPPKLSVVACIYNNTARTSAFRKIMVAWYTWGTCMSFCRELTAGHDLAQIPEFAADLAVSFALMSAFKEKNPMLSSSSMLYEKDSEEVKEDKAE
jgi:hypothetical protein